MSIRGASLTYFEAREELERISAAQGGDRPAFLALVRQYGLPLYRASYAMTHDPRAAASLTRDAFVHAWREIRALRDGERFYPWILGIARSLHPTPSPGTVPAGRLRGAVASTHAETRDEEALVLAAFAVLRPDEQAILSLRTLERISYEEIASVLDLSLGVATLRLSQARGHLLASLGTAEEPGESDEEEAMDLAETKSLPEESLPGESLPTESLP